MLIFLFQGLVAGEDLPAGLGSRIYACQIMLCARSLSLQVAEVKSLVSTLGLGAQALMIGQ